MPGGGSLNPASHETVDKKMHYIHQDGKNVFKYAVKKMAEMTERVLEKNGLTGKDVDCFIAHQPTGASSPPPPNAWACRWTR